MVRGEHPCGVRCIYRKREFMNIRLIGNTLGYVLWVEAGFMLLPTVISLCCGDGCVTAFLSAFCLCTLCGTLLRLIPVRNRQMQGRDGYATVALAWIVLSVFGAVPYLFSHAISHYADALFETISGLTTTGSTILGAVEDLPRSILLWRSETQWMGGMGVLVLFLALMPKLGDGAVYLMRAESPGPIKSKLVPKLSQTAKILYGIYVGLTALETLSLRIAGMSWFDRINHAFTTIATGGFSVRNESIAAYGSNAIVWIITAFTFLAGVNFGLMFTLLCGKWRQVLRSEELRTYTVIVAAAAALICLDLCLQNGAAVGQSITDAVFQATTIITTTGFATRDFALWPTFSRCVLVALMYIGGCAGSTAGGMKVSRLMLLGKSLRRDLQRILHPNRVSTIRIDGEVVTERAVTSAHAFQVAYLFVAIAGTLIVALDDIGFTESLVASLTCISNVGPGLGALGPMSNFAVLSDLSKYTLSLVMLMGRLELMPILVLLSPATWRGK